MTTTLFGRIFQRARWDRVEFPAVELTQQGARAVTEHEVWRRDGAELVNGGRKAYRGKITAAFFNNIPGYGELFPGMFELLVRSFEDEAEVEFAHPVLGTFRAMALSWEPRVTKDTRNGAFVDFEWVEQKASSVGVVALDLDRGDGDPRTNLSAAAGDADSSLAEAGAPAPTQLVVVADDVLKKTAQPLPYADLANVLDTLDTATRVARGGLLAAPMPPSLVLARHRARAALARLQGASRRLRAALLPDPSRTRLYATSRPMTLAELSLSVYGNPFRAADLRSANALAADVVPAGRVVRALP